MSPSLEVGLYVFVLATFLGLEVIRRVSPLLHTPLMSLTNAISAIAVVGSILVAGEQKTTLSTVLGTARRDRLDDQHRRRLPDHLPHAADVQEKRERPPMSDQAIPLLYLAAAASFILALKWLSAVPTARRGVIVGVAGMALAVGGTLLKPEIESYRWIAVAFVAGHRHRRPDGDDADDRGAAADRALARLRRPRGGAGRDGRVLPADARHRPLHHGGAGRSRCSSAS